MTLQWVSAVANGRRFAVAETPAGKYYLVKAAYWSLAFVTHDDRRETIGFFKKEALAKRAAEEHAAAAINPISVVGWMMGLVAAGVAGYTAYFLLSKPAAAAAG